MYDTVGERIRFVRGGESLPTFAKRFDIHKNTLVRYEKGEGHPDSKFLQRLCGEFELSPAWLLFGTGPMRSGDQVATPPEHSPPCATDKEAYLQTAQDPNQSIDNNMGLGQAVELLAKIFGSNNHILMRAIIANLQAFGEAIDNKNKELQARAEMEQMQVRMDAMEKQMKTLLEEIKELRAAQSGAAREDNRKVANGH